INVYTDDAEATQSLLQQSLSGYDVKNRIQQEEASFKMISIEKWVTFLMLTFILIIASFNIISTISILIIDKEPNMAILSAMGATKSMIKRIFVYQGWLISVAGGIIGIALGVVLSLIQQYFGIIGLSASSTANLSVDAYPVVVSLIDILIVAGVIIVTGTITAFVAVRR
ncbi:MAG: ABC transporter permease, partial [Muribaculaceae bacterium]